MIRFLLAWAVALLGSPAVVFTAVKVMDKNEYLGMAVIPIGAFSLLVVCILLAPQGAFTVHASSAKCPRCASRNYCRRCAPRHTGEG